MASSFLELIKSSPKDALETAEKIPSDTHRSTEKCRHVDEISSKEKF